MGGTVLGCQNCQGEALLAAEHLESPTWLCPHCGFVNQRPAMPVAAAPRRRPDPPAPSTAEKIQTVGQSLADIGKGIMSLAALIFIGFIVWAAVSSSDGSSGGTGADDAVADSGDAGGASAFSVRYAVIATSQIGTLTWNNDTGDTQQDSTESHRQWSSPEYSMVEGQFAYISAQNASGGEITCEIYINGVKVESNTSRGEYAICTASGSI